MTKIIGNKIGNIVNIFIDGNSYQKTFDDSTEAKDFYKLMIDAKDGDDQALSQLQFLLKKKYKTLIKDTVEYDNDGNYYIKGINIVLPELLKETLLDYLDNGYPVKALVNFWTLLVTNPDTRVREDLFKFLQTYNFTITDNGYFVGYKAVNIKEEVNNDLAKFVSDNYLKIKKWKKSPKSYSVVQNDDTTDGVSEYVLLHVDDIDMSMNVKGNLEDLFKNIPNMTTPQSTFETITTLGPKMEVKLGVPVKMKRGETDGDPRVECSSGLHVGSVQYVQTFGSGNEKRVLSVLVNPANVVAVPTYDNSKMRVCEYFPYAELQYNGQTFEVIEEPYIEEDYMNHEWKDVMVKLDEIKNSIVTEDTPSDIVQLDYAKILENRTEYLELALN